MIRFQKEKNNEIWTFTESNTLKTSIFIWILSLFISSITILLPSSCSNSSLIHNTSCPSFHPEHVTVAASLSSLPTVHQSDLSSTINSLLMSTSPSVSSDSSTDQLFPSDLPFGLPNNALLPTAAPLLDPSSIQSSTALASSTPLSNLVTKSLSLSTSLPSTLLTPEPATSFPYPWHTQDAAQECYHTYK